MQKELTYEDVEAAASFFAKNISTYKTMFERLSNRSKTRVDFTLVYHPLNNDNEIPLTEYEKNVVDLGIALLNAKLMMFSYAGEEQMKLMDNKKEGEENNGKES